MRLLEFGQMYSRRVTAYNRSSTIGRLSARSRRGELKLTTRPPSLPFNRPSDSHGSVDTYMTTSTPSPNLHFCPSPSRRTNHPPPAPCLHLLTSSTNHLLAPLAASTSACRSFTTSPQRDFLVTGRTLLPAPSEISNSSGGRRLEEEEDGRESAIPARGVHSRTPFERTDG